MTPFRLWVSTIRLLRSLGPMRGRGPHGKVAGVTLRRLFTMAGLLLLLGALLTGVDGANPRLGSVRVDALWYGRAADGSIQAGVTPVEVAATFHDPTTPLLIDTGGLRAAGAGPMWTAATAVAEIQAVLIAGVDPRTVQVSYALKEAIDGPSAGALLSAASLASISGIHTVAATTMTGTVLPDGSIGPVSGVSDKLRAAKAAGYTRVLVPEGPSIDLATGATIDPVAFGRSIGVNVLPVDDVPEAFKLLTGAPDVARSQQSSPIAPGVVSMLEQRTRRLVTASTTQLQGLRATSDPQVRAALPGIEAWTKVAQEELNQGDAVRAFAAAAEAGQALQEFGAVERSHEQAASMSLTDQIARVRTDAAQAKQQIRAALLATAATPVSTVEQLAALPDVLAWGLFALTSMDAADQQLAAVQTQADLDEVIRFVQTARFEAANYMPATADSLPFIGKRPLADPKKAAAFLDAYGALIASGASANTAYADSLRLVPQRRGYLQNLIDSTRPLAEGTGSSPDADLEAAPGTTAGAALRLGAALLEYVETTQLVNNLTSQSLTAASSAPNSLPIQDRTVVARQARTAATITADQTAVVTGAGLDPSYLQWNSQWGQELAFGRLPEITDEQTLHGLEYQWFAVLHSRVLVALANQ